MDNDAQADKRLNGWRIPSGVACATCARVMRLRSPQNVLWAPEHDKTPCYQCGRTLEQAREFLAAELARYAKGAGVALDRLTPTARRVLLEAMHSERFVDTVATQAIRWLHQNGLVSASHVGSRTWMVRLTKVGRALAEQLREQ